MFENKNWYISLTLSFHIVSLCEKTFQSAMWVTKTGKCRMWGSAHAYVVRWKSVGGGKQMS
jgi:hypothetical protein